ncbi:MAG: hypothetical protein RLZZ413_2691, partial [Pseudomonadota bacterium]
MIDKLEMFIALANERHFGRAAEVCGVTQPTLSSAIRQLEDQLGVQLVFRGSRFQGLTPEGVRVLDWARRIVSDMRALKAEMKVVRSGLSGTVRIGVIPTALPMVAELTAPFIARHPNVRVSILSRTSVEILAEIESLELDAGITYLDNEPLGRVAQVPLYTEFYRLLCAPGTALAGRAQVTWAEVARTAALPADIRHAEPPHREPASGRGRGGGGAAGRIEFHDRADRPCDDGALGQRGAHETRWNGSGGRSGGRAHRRAGSRTPYRPGHGPARPADARARRPSG